MTNDDRRSRMRDFPFEQTIRHRYRSFRDRPLHGLASLADLGMLVLILGFVILVMTVIFFVLLAVLISAPFIILASAAWRRILPQKPEPYDVSRQHRDADVTVIDVEVD